VSAPGSRRSPDEEWVALAVPRRGYWRNALRRLIHQKATVAALGLLLAIFVAGALAPLLAPHGWNSIDLDQRWRNHAPTLAAGHLLGTDNIGRDTLRRALWGLHYSEQTAFVGGLAATLLALVVGVYAGFRGGWPDALLMRLADLVTGFPVLVLLVAAFVWLRPVTVWEATLVFALAMWPFAARVFRARAASLGAEEFVQAARALGASNRRIVLRHLIPNAAGAIVVSATSLIGQIVLIEATAEFLGYGVRSVTRPTLGNLIGEATSTGIGPFNQLALGWWVWVTPVSILVAVLLCVNLIGDGLDAALNPRTTHA
jgi:ABC-type dipeptide/oligopeptide/nickel transport system permease subunit